MNNQKLQKFEEPEIEVLSLNVRDILTVSGNDPFLGEDDQV